MRCTPDAAFTTNNPTILAAPWKTTRGMSLNPHRISIFDDSYITREMHLKNYEISDHLGNVRAVVSDLKLSTLNVSTGVPEDFEPELKVINNLYAFGSNQPNRSFFDADGSGTFGFNGMLKDNEIKGEGNSYDFGARMYDPRIGKWLAMDDFSDKYPSISPYTFALNNPILMKDSDGNLVTDADGNPVYINVGETFTSPSPEYGSETFEKFQVRAYFANDGSKIYVKKSLGIYVKAVEHSFDDNGQPISVLKDKFIQHKSSDDRYYCHSWSILVSRDISNDNLKGDLPSTFYFTDEKGKKIEEHPENLPQLFGEGGEYELIPGGISEASEVAKNHKVVVTFQIEGQSEINHSSILNPDGTFSTKNDREPQNNSADYENQKNYGNVINFYKYKGDNVINIKTKNGKVNSEKKVQKAISKSKN